MFKYTTSTLNKLEAVLKEAGYTLRYEKGSFKPGYCVLESKKVVVANKFYPLEGKINSIVELLSNIEIDEKLLTDKSRFTLAEARQQLLFDQKKKV